MDVQRTIEKANEALTVRRVYGDPFEKDGVIVIPAARVQAARVEAVEKALEGKAKGRGAGSP